jgi:hypothetical protein
LAESLNLPLPGYGPKYLYLKCAAFCVGTNAPEKKIRISFCAFHGLCPLACSDSEITSETMNPFRHFGI